MAYHIANLLEKMNSADKDYRFMATNDLMAELQKDSIKLDDDSEKKVVKMLLRLLEDKNGEVQNLAVKCLGPLVNKVKELQVETIVDTLCNNLVCDNEQLRDSSSMALKTVIAELPAPTSATASLTNNVTRRVMPRLTAAVNLTEQTGGNNSATNASVRLESLEIMADILNRYGSLVASFHQQIEEVLVPCLASARLGVRKRAITALAHLVACCSGPLFDHIMLYLCEQLNANTSVSTSRTYVLCVAAVSRSVPHTRFGVYLPQIVPQLLQFCEQHDDDELREAVLHAFESFVYRCPKDVDAFVSDMLRVCTDFLSHDPNYHYDDDDMNGDTDGAGMDIDGASQASDDEEEEDSYSDDDDMSWKVRRAAAKCLEAVIGARRDRVLSLLQTVAPLLIHRLKEREENVKTDIFQAYISLLRQSTLCLPAQHHKRLHKGTSHSTQNGHGTKTAVKYNAEQLEIITVLQAQVPLLVRAVCRQLRTSSLRTRQSCVLVLCHLLRALPAALSSHMDTVLPTIAQYALQDKSNASGCSSNLKIDALQFLAQALCSHPPEVFSTHVSLITKLVCASIGDSFYKVAAEALNVVQPLVITLSALSDTDPEATQLIEHLYDAVFTKLKATDIDQEVKEKAIRACGQLVHECSAVLQSKMSACLPLLLDRLRNEMTRLTTVNAMVTIACSAERVDLQAIMDDMSTLLADFLRKNQRALKISTMHLLHALLENYSSAWNERTVTCIVNELPPLVSDSDLQISQLVLKFLSALLAQPLHALVLLKSSAVQNDLLGADKGSLIVLCQSAMLQGSTMKATLHFLAAYTRAQNDNSTQTAFAALYASLTSCVYAAGAGPSTGGSGVHRHAYLSTAKCVAAVASQSTAHEQLALAQQLHQHIKTGLAHNTVSTDGQLLFSLYCLGEVARYCPAQCKQIKPEKLIVDAFQSGSEDIKTAASYSLGALCAGDLATYVPFLLKQIETQPKRQYLLLHALKEVIGSESADEQTAAIFRPRIDDIWAVLLSHASCAEEGTRNVVSECIGKLCLMDSARLLPNLQKQMGGDVNVRATCVCALKFMLHDVHSHTQHMDELLAQHMNAFLQAVHDEDLNVRRVALITFNSAVHNKPHLVSPLLDQLLASLYAETKVRKELVREVEMGPFKHTVDEGLDLRKAAFECMYTLLETCMERLDIFEFLTHVEDGLKVTQRLDGLVEPLRLTLTNKVKPNAVKQEYEKNDELKRSAMRAIMALNRMPDGGKHSPLVDLVAMIRATPDLNTLLLSVERDPVHRQTSTYTVGGAGGAHEPMDMH